jgi:uncharacterized protein YegJ (DUF2314 family)
LSVTADKKRLYFTMCLRASSRLIKNPPKLPAFPAAFAYIKVSNSIAPRRMNWLKRLFGRKKKGDLPRHGVPHKIPAPSESERMQWAIEKARLTLHYFKNSLLSPGDDQNNFQVKVSIVDGIEVEHLWLTDVTCDDSDIFYGTVSSMPSIIHNLTIGKMIGVDVDHISDWMIVEGGKLIGGYTIRAIRDGLDEKKRKIFDRQLGYLIDEGVDHFEHNFTTPEGAILCIEDAYDAHDINRVIACKDFEAEARLMLSNAKHMGTLATNPEIVTETEEAVRSTFIKFIDDYGFPSFKNVKRAFPFREFLRDDLCIITEVCQYPDHTKSTERLYVSRRNGEWKVLNPAD